MIYLKVLALVLFALAALGSGVCTLLLLPSLGQEYVGWLPLLFGLPLFAVCSLIAWLLWRHLRRAKPAQESPRP